MYLKESSISHSILSPSDSYAFQLQACLKNKDPGDRKSIHARSIKVWLHLSTFLVNNLINFYAKTGLISDAQLLFDEMPFKNRFSWNTILSAYAKSGRFHIPRCLFGEMPEQDSVSWTTMIVGYNQMGLFQDAVCMFLEIIREGIMPTQFAFTNILTSCASLEAWDVVSWNSITAGYNQHGVFEAERPGCRFSFAQRVGTYFYKGVLYGSVGFVCGLIGQGIANVIMNAKRSIKRSDEDIPVPPLVKSAALWGIFLAVSSNTRYQIINGLEGLVEASPMAKRVPPVALAFTVGIRFANNIYGGMQFVDWARWSGVQ